MSDHARGHRQYFINIAWSWLSVATALMSGIIITPILIRRLGTAQFGVWAVAASLVEYFWLIDLGLRPATVKLTAEFRALDRSRDINALINTALSYSAIAGGLLLLIAWPNAERIGALVHITHPDFPFLIRAVGLSWAFGLVFNIFSAVTEGFQRFDLSNRVGIISVFLRSTISLVLVLMGYGLRQMGIAVLIAQGTAYTLMYLYCRSVYPELRLSPRYFSKSMALEVIRYARQLVSAMVGGRLTQASLPGLIAYFRPTQFVTYYTQSLRILEYVGDAISRVGLVTAPRAADMLARGRPEELIELTQYGNRYCMTLFGLLGSFLFVYGGDLCRLWINPEFGHYAGLLLPILLVGYTLWHGQFISAAVLMGIGKYHAYSTTLLVESIATTGAFALLLPHFGLVGAVAALTTNLAIARCFMLSRIFASTFNLRMFPFLRASIQRPLLLIVTSILALFAVHHALPTPSRWFQLLIYAAAFGACYIVAALFCVFERDHRRLLFEKVFSMSAKLLRRRPAEAAV